MQEPLAITSVATSPLKATSSKAAAIITRAGSWTSLINPDDPEELELLAMFQRKLKELRGVRPGGQTGIQPNQAAHGAHTIQPMASTPTALQLTPGFRGKWSLLPMGTMIKDEVKTEPVANTHGLMNAVPEKKR